MRRCSWSETVRCRSRGTMRSCERIALLALTAIVSLQLQGCATSKLSRAAPALPQPIAVQLSASDLSAWADLPLGVYRIPDSEVVISGHQKGINTAAFLFGLVGLAVAHQVNADTGERRVHDVAGTLKIRLDDQLMAAVSQLVASEGLSQAFATSSPGGGSTLTLTPGLILTYVSDTDIRPFVVIKANLTDSNHKEVWMTRYVASTGVPRPLSGADGWAENDAAALKLAIQICIEQVVRVMLSDVSHPFPRDEANLVTVEGNFPFMKSRVQAVGYK